MATTRLQAINQMLEIIGEPPVESISVDIPESIYASEILDQASLEVQSMNWHFNRESNVKFTPDATNQIPIDNTQYIRVDNSDPSENHYVVRRGKLYDLYRHSNEFKTPVFLDVVLNLSWDDLPETAKKYIITKAGSRFQKRFLGSATLDQFNSQEEQRAMINLQMEDLNNADLTLLNNPFVAHKLNRLR